MGKTKQRQKYLPNQPTNKQQKETPHTRTPNQATNKQQKTSHPTHTTKQLTNKQKENPRVDKSMAVMSIRNQSSELPLS